MFCFSYITSVLWLILYKTCLDSIPLNLFYWNFIFFCVVELREIGSQRFFLYLGIIYHIIISNI